MQISCYLEENIDFFFFFFLIICRNNKISLIYFVFISVTEVFHFNLPNTWLNAMSKLVRGKKGRINRNKTEQKSHAEIMNLTGGRQK